MTSLANLGPPGLGVDTHAHVFHRNLQFAPQRRYTPDYDAYPQDYLALLDRHGIQHGVLIALSVLGSDNSYLLQTLAENRQRLRGIITMDPKLGPDAIAALDQQGVVGLRVNLTGDLPIPDFESDDWQAVLAACRRHAWQVELNDRACRLPLTVKPLLKAGVAIVVDHFGVPDTALGTEDPGFRFLLDCAATGSVWVKLSGPHRSSFTVARAAAPLLRKAFGPERLLWGSDWPFTGHEGKGLDYGRMTASLTDWLPDSDERRIVLVDTPQKLFRF
ncbi:MAG: amidohydrolase family protein [Pusillimonas sp.]